MAGIKMSGKFAHQVELGEAAIMFRREWLPYVTPGTVDRAWSDYIEGLLETGWISDWQSKNWAMPEFGIV